LEARGPQDLFARAQAEYYFGNCCTMLARFDEARPAYQSAQALATQYLLVKGAPPHLAWDKLMWSEVEQGPPKTFGGLLRRVAIISPGFALMFVNPVVGVATSAGLMAASGKIDDKIHDLQVRRAREAFVTTVTPVLDFTGSLQQLQIRAPDLAIEFDSPSLTLDTLQERLREG
jgi:hypothetical protein